MESPEAIAVSGAGGFIGHSVCRRLIESKIPVRALVRYRSDTPGEFQFDLANSIIDPSALQPAVKAMIHCAWDTRARSLSESRLINIAGTEWLINRCREAGIKHFIFISSLSAHEDAQSVYGKTKWEMEHKLMALPDAASFVTIIAAGTVVGRGGAFAGERTKVKRREMIPIFKEPDQQRMQTVFIDELVDVIMTALANRITGRLCVGDPTGVELTDFYRGLAALDGGKLNRFQVPGKVALLASRAMESIGMKPKIRSDDLLGYKHLRVTDVTETNRRLGRQPVMDYWQSLQKLAEQEGAPDVAARIRELAAQIPPA